MDKLPSTSGGIKRALPQEFQDEMEEIAEKLPRLKAVLDDNQKRYLIVGMCLHSIISPALRKYVVPILTALYEELILKQKIDTQTYPTQLKQYQPTEPYLYYDAVNNNKKVYGYQYAKYDYKIKSVVDSSKLFLHPRMALYTGFDETCDSSALLGLIISIDKFPAVVRSQAKDVRDEVRNLWAHCDFTDWNAKTYADSFQLMTNLVKNLSMSSTDESQALLEMKKWEINVVKVDSLYTAILECTITVQNRSSYFPKSANLETDLQLKGPSSLNGTNEICRLLNVLVKSLKHVAKETDNTSAEIKRLLDIVENQDTLLDYQKGEIEFWEKQEASFVDTPVVNVISKILESEDSVLIIGEPGIGKSMLMHNVALKVQKNIDYDIIPCAGVQDILQHYKQVNKQMFVIDDICGRFTVSPSDIENWIKNEDRIKRILKKGKTKIVATCRLDIYNDEKFKEAYSVFKSNIFNLSERYTREDKITICRYYLSEADIQLVQEENVDFTPLMCYLYSKNNHFSLTDFLECPFETYQKEWDKLKVLDPSKYCSLLLCVIYNGIMTDLLFDIYNENSAKNKSVWENIFEICGFDRGPSRSKIQTVLDSMIGTYVLKKRNEYRVIHDQMFDFMCGYFGNKDTMVRCILRYSDIRVFNQRTQLESINEQHGKFTIMISKKLEKEYFERIKCDLLLGKMNQCFYNTQMKYEVYRTSFLKTLKSIDDTFLNRLNVTNADSIETMEFEGGSDSDDYEDNNYDDYEDDDNPFIKSCLRGYYDIVQFFISKNVDRQSCDSIHLPLTAACKGGNEKIVQLLLDKESDVNQVDGGGYTPLTAACSHIEGTEKIVQLLIDKGSDVNQVGGRGCTPLTAACKGGNEKIVQLLLDKGSDVNQIDDMEYTPLTAACSKGNEKIVQLLIDRGSDVNQVGRYGYTPLTAACSHIEGTEKIVQLLIDKGCDVNQVGSFGYTPLTAACHSGNEKIVQLLLDKGSDVNQVDGGDRYTPLTAACKGGNEKIVQLLLDKGSDVNQIDGTGYTPLNAACSKGNEKIVQLLIDKGSDVNQVGCYGYTPLTAACSHIEGTEKIVQLLIDKGSDVNQAGSFGFTPLTAACHRGNEKIVQLLIDKGSDVNQVNRRGCTPMTAVFSDGGYADSMIQTPLLAACSGGNKKIVQLLIYKGSDVNQVDGNGYTPLTYSCDSGNEKIVQSLIDKGSEVNQIDGKGQTPLITACVEGNEKIIQILINKGSDVNQVGNYGYTPLTFVCKIENEKIVKLIIDQGSDVNQVDGKGQTPLITACSEGNEKIIQILIDKGSDVNQVDGGGYTPLTAACKGGNEKIVQLLLDKGSDVNRLDGSGYTPLLAACSGGNKKIVQLLINKGSDVNQVDDKGQTPLITACKGGQEELVQLLIDNGSEVNTICEKWQTPLIIGCRKGNEQIVQIFLDKGCDINKSDAYGETPLTICCLAENEKIVQLLLDKGCDVNQVNGNGDTPLTITCMTENEKIVQLLIDKEVDVNKVNTDGETPLTISCCVGNEKIVQLLIEKGCDVDKVDANGDTPLTLFRMLENEKIMHLLEAKELMRQVM